MINNIPTNHVYHILIDFFLFLKIPKKKNNEESSIKKRIEIIPECEEEFEFQKIGNDKFLKRKRKLHMLERFDQEKKSSNDMIADKLLNFKHF